MTEVFVVAGASGRVGHPVAERLLSAGHEVRVVGRNARTLTPLSEQGAQVRVGSFQDHDFFTAALRGATAAFVLTPLGFRRPISMRSSARTLSASRRRSENPQCVMWSCSAAGARRYRSGSVG
jgi:uncharacterized protein YbjT (DUF2867 family)